MSELTVEELKWFKRVQRALNSCPSNRIGFYTTGDSDLTLYDKSTGVDEASENASANDNKDFCNWVDEFDARFERLNFPSYVLSTAG